MLARRAPDTHRRSGGKLRLKRLPWRGLRKREMNERTGQPFDGTDISTVEEIQIEGHHRSRCYRHGPEHNGQVVSSEVAIV